MSGARDKVIWIGAVPDIVRRELAARGLELVEEADVARVIALAQHGGRAVVIHVPSVETLEPVLTAVTAPCRDAGAMVLLATDHRYAEQLVAINRAQASVAAELPACKPPLFVLAEADAAARLAELCRTHEPGPSLETAPTLGPPDVVESLEPGLRCLLERAFYGMATVELVEFTGGRSSARVFRVDGTDADGRKHVTMIAKVDRADRIEQEILNTEAFVRPYVEPWWYAALVRERCMFGSRDAVLVGTFLAGARSLDDFLPTASSVPALMVAVFDGPLKKWRGNARIDVPLQLAQAYRTWGVLESQLDALIEAHRRAEAGGYAVMPPDEILAILDGLPPVKVSIRMTHGDLQPRNVFVRDAGHIFLIDFYGTRHEAAASRDAANLDVSLAFETKAGLDEAALRSLFRSPVLRAATGVFPDPWRAAIAQVRVQAAGDNISEWEYDVSIACYLLRMARLGVQYGEPSDERLSLAYFLASELAASLRGRSPPAALL